MFAELLIPGLDFPLNAVDVYIGFHGFRVEDINKLHELVSVYGTTIIATHLRGNGMSVIDIQVLFGYMGVMQ